MTESDDVKKNFYKKLSYNIGRYQQITATSDQNLADVLGLSVPELKNRMCGIEPFTAWELYQWGASNGWGRVAKDTQQE